MTAEDRQAMSQMGRYRTQVPKRVFRYTSAEEMDADRLRWAIDAIKAREARR